MQGSTAAARTGACTDAGPLALDCGGGAVFRVELCGVWGDRTGGTAGRDGASEEPLAVEALRGGGPARSRTLGAPTEAHAGGGGGAPPPSAPAGGAPSRQLASDAAVGGDEALGDGGLGAARLWARCLVLSVDC